jgi:hypothetical protein
MRNWIPQSILGTGPSEQEQLMMQQLQESQAAIQALTQQLAEKQSIIAIEKQRADIDALNHLALRYENERQDSIQAFKAETDRLKAILANMKPEQMNAIAQKTYEEIEVQQPPAVEYDQTQFDPSQLIHDYLPNIQEPVQQQPQQMEQQPQEQLNQPQGI